MARKPRKYAETDMYHVVLRGVDKNIIFFDDMDKQKMTDSIRKYALETEGDIFAYCLMDNHIHMAVRAKEEYLGIFIKKISSSYVYYFNKKYDRVGHLFQERFRSEPILDDSQFIATVRYIHRNPEKAGIMKTPLYKWSSYNEYFEKDTFVDKTLCMGILGKTSEYVRYMNEDNKDKFLEYDDKSKVTDEEAKKIAVEMLGADYIKEMRLMDKSAQEEILRKLLERGVAGRQAARITGLNRAMADKVSGSKKHIS